MILPIVYYGGRVHTMDPASRTVTAIAIENGRIKACGTDSDLRASAGRGTTQIDLDGATVLPGLIDTHPHLLHFGSLREPLVDITDCRAHDEIVARIARRAATTPEGEWIMTTPVGEPHYFIRRSHRDLAEETLPTCHVLDRATTRHPVVIQAWAPALPNAIAFNSLALTRLGLTRDMPERIDNVWIETDAAGELTGRLHGSVTNYYSNDAFANSLWLKIPFLKYEFLIPGTKTAIRAYQRQGVTAIYENHMMDKKLLDAYRTMRRAHELEMRVLMSQEAESYGMPWSRPRTMPDFMARLEEAAAAIELRDERLRFNGVTVMWDGTCFPGGMMMNEVYLGPYGGRTTGYYNTAPDKVKAAMRFCAERRLRLNTMCMGNRANEENLRLLERLARTHDIAALNWVLVHSVFIDPEQVTRYKALNFSLTTSMSFCWGKGELFRKRIGDHVLKDLMPLRRFFAAGMAVAGASDWGPKNPWEQIQLSLTHEFCGSGYRNLGPDQKISREQALAMWTRDAATVMRWDDIGALVPGANADLVIVDRDPLSCPVEDISGTRVLRTVFAGDPVFDAGVL